MTARVVVPAAASAGSVIARKAPTNAAGLRPVPIVASRAEAQPAAAVAIDDDFRAGEMLEHRPSPIGDVVTVPYPATAFSTEQVTVQLTLLIDERGRVVDVRVDGSAPGPFAEAAKQAFIGVTFLPGQSTTGTVKSKLRLEVAFDGPAASDPGL